MVERWTVVPMVGCSIHPDETFPCSPMVRIPGFHPGDLGSIPSMGGGFKDSIAEWLTRRPAKPVSFGGAGSNPAAVACTNGRVVKALRLGRNLFGGMGSNPISYKKC